MTVTLAAFTPLTADDCTADVSIFDAAHPVKALDMECARVHVGATHVALNGQLLAGVVDYDLHVGKETITHVTLWIDPQQCDVAAPFRSKHGEWVYGGINGHPVLCPAKDNGTGSGWTWDEEREVVECEFYVGRIVIE